MGVFLYFKTGYSKPTVSLESLESWGIGYAFEKKPLCRQAELGKHGLGTVFMEQPPAPTPGSDENDPKKRIGRIGVYPEEQVWEKVPGTDCFVGYYKDDMPGVDDLSRQQPLNSYVLRLNNNEDWSVPRVVHAPEGVAKYNLPCRLDVDGDGVPCDGEPIAKYQYLWELVTPYIDAFLTTDQEKVSELDDKKILHDAISILQVNYKIGVREAVIMDLFTREIRDLPLTLCLLAIDYPTFIKWQEDLKKSESPEEPDGLSTPDGQKDSAKDTSQLQPS